MASAGFARDITATSTATSGLRDSIQDFARNRTGGISAPFNQGLKVEYVVAALALVAVVWLFKRRGK